jgi:ElaB/YqjD/DUF883 family membrane-anchored ribosome-binding protein
MNDPTEKLVADARILASDVEELVKATAAQSGERLTAARQRAETALANAGSAMAIRGSAAVDTTEHYVRDNPWAVAGLCVAAGALLGFLIGRH